MRLNVETLGDGPDLVLLHGWGMNNAVWAGFGNVLATRWRVHMIELPGHGRSPPPDSERADDWAAACLAAAPAQAAWVGWSLGGVIALLAAEAAPERVAAFFGIACTPRFVRADDWPHALKVEVLAGFAEQLSGNPRLTLQQFLALQVRGGDAARPLLRRLRQRFAERPDPDSRALRIGLDILRDVDARAALGALRCPLHWALGERDTLVPIAVGEDLRRLNPACALSIVPGAAHAPFLSHVSILTRWIDAFQS